MSSQFQNVLCMLNALPGAWIERCNVIPAYAGIQIRGAAWIPAYAGMTTTLRVPYVDTPEYITRSQMPGPEMLSQLVCHCFPASAEAYSST